MVCPYLDIAWPYLVALANLSNGLWTLLLFRFLWRFFEQHVQFDPRRCCSADVGALDFLFFLFVSLRLFVRNVVVYRNVCWCPVQLCVALIIFSTGSACALNYLLQHWSGCGNPRDGDWNNAHFTSSRWVESSTKVEWISEDWCKVVSRFIHKFKGTRYTWI